MPCCHALVIPFTEQRSFERQAVGLEEGKEAARKASAVEVEEVTILPVGLEVSGRDECELRFLVFAVVQADAAAASDFIDNSDVGGQTKVFDGGSWDERIAVAGSFDGVGWEQNRGCVVGRSSEIVGKVDKTLTSHASPRMVARRNSF